MPVAQLLHPCEALSIPVADALPISLLLLYTLPPPGIYPQYDGGSAMDQYM